jgi:hypothetical protein
MSAYKKTKLVILILLAILIAAGLAPTAGSSAAASSATVKDITLQPGGDERSMNFCWHSVSGEDCSVQIAASPAGDTGRFPAQYRTFTGAVASASKGWYTNKVAVTGLESETGYVYRVANGTTYGETGAFKTGSSSAAHVLFVSDAQIGASGSATADKAAWEKSLSAMLGRFPGTNFIMSAGDQVDYYLESEYDAFLSPEPLRRYPLAPAVGNHENIGSSPLFGAYFNAPNESDTDGVTPAGGDYWFKYGNTLFIVLNTSNTSTAQHDDFIGRAIAADPCRTWTVLMFHHSLYSSAGHSASSFTRSLRDKLVPVIDKYDIDVVLSGHDHCYTRSYQMLGGQPFKTQTTDAQGRLVNPSGSLYIAAGSSTGSKYYDLTPAPEAYAAARVQPKAPTFTDISIDGGILTMTTYRADTMAVIDTVALLKQTVAGFTDVPDGAWYAPAVTWLVLKHIADGTSEQLFSPDLKLTRGQCLVLLMKAYGIQPEPTGSPNFDDAGNTWYTGYLAASKRLGLAGGIGGNRFLPDGMITRQDMAALVYNTLVHLGKQPAGAVRMTYSDSASITPYARTAVEALSEAGVLSGSGGAFDPKGLSTRAQMAQILYRLLADAQLKQ